MESLTELRRSLEVAQRAHAAAEARYQVQVAQYETALAALRDEFQVSSVEEAEALLVRLSDALHKKAAELDAYVERLEA